MTNKQYRMMQFKEMARQNKQLEKDRQRMTAEHAEYLKRDIVEIYSAMAVVMFNNGNSSDDIAELIGQIQEEWHYHVNHKAERGDITMAQYCTQLTGIDLEANVE